MFGRGKQILAKLTELEKRMSQLSDAEAALTTAVNNLTTAVTSGTTQISTETQKILDLLASGSVTPADIAQLTSSATAVQSAADGINKSVADAQAALNPPPAAKP